MSDAANDNNKTEILSDSELPPALPHSRLSSFAQQEQQAQQNTLPIGTRLGEFEIIDLVGEGGFGIVYLAQDHSLQRRVALKEYMPTSLASRRADSSIHALSERHRETFEIGRRSFVNEARLLAQFDHPALVKVYRFWEANGTAYMAMPFYEGRTLRDALREFSAPPDEAWIRKILAPVIDSLELIHQEHCYHRDIAPDNIMLLRGDRPVLLDFGAARRVISDMTQALTVILKPGYAPVEQYAEMPGMKQGPWTDVYALAAVVYFMITSRTPPPSVGRIVQDSYRPLAKEYSGDYDITFLRGVDKSLSVNLEDRPQSMSEMRDLLGMMPQSRVFAPPAAKAVAAIATGNAATAPIVQTAKAQEAAREKRLHQAEPVAVASSSARAGISPAKRMALGVLVAGAIGVAALLTNKFASKSTPQAPMPAAVVTDPIPQTESVTPTQREIPATSPVQTVPPDIAQPATNAPVMETASSSAGTASSSVAPVNEVKVAPVKVAPVKKAPTPRPQAASKPVRKEEAAPPPVKQRSKSTPEQEREYLRKLNKDLDNL